MNTYAAAAGTLQVTAEYALKDVETILQNSHLDGLARLQLEGLQRWLQNGLQTAANWEPSLAK